MVVTGQRGTVEPMKKGKRKGPQKSKPMDLPNPLKVDEGEFTDAIRKMVNAPPETLEEVKSRRRKNPETDPRYLPVFDFSHPLTREQLIEVRQKQELAKENAEWIEGVVKQAKKKR